MLIKNIHREFMLLNKEDRRNILLVAFNLFLVLFSYPLVRATSTAMFIETYGAKSTPVIWILSVVLLSLSVLLLNFLQKKRSVFFLYSFVSILTTIVFVVCNLLYAIDLKQIAYLYAVWKEVYIILLVHLSIGYLNSKVSHETARLTYGPLGALGSLGGVLGGLCVAKVIPFFNSMYGDGSGLILSGMLGAGIICITTILFHSENSFLVQREKPSPLNSIKNKANYVIIISLIVMLSQFVINLANFKFNLGVESYVSGAEGKGVFLGKIYSSVNFVSFIFQIFLIPILLKVFREQKVHLLIPVIFLAIFVSSSFSLGFAPVAIMFVAMKGVDYSLFSTAKEMLYFPISKEARYGAKYIVDMVVYRFSKMLISLVLLTFTSITFVNSMMALCLILWLILVVYMIKNFKEQSNE